MGNIGWELQSTQYKVQYFRIPAYLVLDVPYSGKYWRGRNIGGFGGLKKTPNLYQLNFFLTYHALVSLSIVWRCCCFVSLKQMIAFLLSRTNFATSASPAILTRMSSLNECVWLLYNRKSAKFKPANMPNFAFQPTFPPQIFPAIRYVLFWWNLWHAQQAIHLHLSNVSGQGR